MDNKQYKKKKQDLVDFNSLSEKELNTLSKTWEEDARIFEARLGSYSSKPFAIEEKVERLWTVGNKLWKRVRILERWRIKNNK